MDKATVISAARFALEQAELYKGRSSEFLLDALLFSHIRTTHDHFQRQYHVAGRSKRPKRIDFINNTNNPAVIELAHRKRGHNVGFSPQANSSEIKKLCLQCDKKWRYLLILDPNSTPLKEDNLRKQYQTFKLKGRPMPRKSVRVVYVHKEQKNCFDFLWRPTSSV